MNKEKKISNKLCKRRGIFVSSIQAIHREFIFKTPHRLPFH